MRVLKESANKTAVLGWGRMQPITIGHEALVNKVAGLAAQNNADPFLYLSHKQNKKSDPLNYEDKLYFANKAFGDKVNVVKSDARTIIEVFEELNKQGYNNVIYVGGEDRIGGVNDITSMIDKYNGDPDKQGIVHYKFDSIKFVNAGDRNADSDDLVTSASGTLARKLAVEGNLEEFKKIVPLDDEDAEDMYYSVREGLGLSESLNEENILQHADGHVDINVCKQFISYINHSKAGSKEQLQNDCIKEFNLQAEGRSIKGCKDFSVRFLQNSTSDSIINGNNNINAAGTVIGVRRIIPRNNKPLFIVTTYNKLNSSIVQLGNLEYITALTHTSANKFKYNSDSDKDLRGSMQHKDISSPMLTPSKFEQIWSARTNYDSELELSRISASTKTHFDNMYSKNSAKRLELPSDFRDKLITNINASINFFSGGGAKRLEEELKPGAEKANELKAEYINLNNKTRANIAEAIIKNPENAEDYINGSLAPQNGNGLADYDNGIVSVDIKYHKNGVGIKEEANTPIKESIKYGMSGGVKLVNVEKLLNSIILNPDKPFVFYIYDQLSNGYVTSVTSLYDVTNINSYGHTTALSGYGSRGTIVGDLHNHKNNIDPNFAYDTFMDLFTNV